MKAMYLTIIAIRNVINHECERYECSLDRAPRQDYIKGRVREILHTHNWEEDTRINDIAYDVAAHFAESNDVTTGDVHGILVDLMELQWN